MTRILLAVLTSALLLSTVGCERGFDREAMLQNIVDQVILPNQTAFAEKAAELEAAVRTFYSEPTEENRVVAQSAWREAVDAWSHVQMFSMGPINRDFHHPPIDRTPTNVDGIEQTIAEQHSITPSLVAQGGSNRKGLPALEYLLFEANLNTQNHHDYLLATADVLAQNAAALEVAWQEYASGFVSAELDNRNTNSSISMLVNEMVRQLEFVMGYGLGQPLGLNITTDGLSHPDLVLSPYANFSKARVLGQLESVQSVFDAGLDDYLDYLNAQYEDRSLSTVIADQIELAISLVEQLDTLEMVVVEDRGSAETAYTAIRTAAIYARVDMTTQLGVLLTFSDADGD